MSFYWFIFGFLLGSVLTKVIMFKFYRIEPKPANSWDCDYPGCKFGVATNNRDERFINVVIEGHKESHV